MRAVTASSPPVATKPILLAKSLDSVVAQTIPPALWVIVDDGSKDETPAILDEYAQKYPFIRVIHRPDRGVRSVGPGVVDAFYVGYNDINPELFDYVCKFDLDLEIPPAYFETMINKMDENPRIGTRSGKLYFRSGRGKLVSEACGDEMSVGMIKFYRTECFQHIGGFVRQVMWDGIDCHRCRQLGWIAASWDEPAIRFIHLRPMGASHKGLSTGRLRHGFGQYFMGTGLVYMTASAVYRMTRPPLVTGGYLMWLGYVTCKSHAPTPASRAMKTPSSARHFAGTSGNAFSWARVRPPHSPTCVAQAEIWNQNAPTSKQTPRRSRQNNSFTLPPIRAPPPLTDPRKTPTTKKTLSHASVFPMTSILTQPIATAALPTVTLHGIRLHALTEKQTIQTIIDRLARPEGGWVVTANLDHIRRLVHDPSYAELCAPADLIVADGMPLVWASRLQRTPLPERVAGSSMVWTLTKAAAQNSRSIFLLGGAPGTAQRAADKLRETFPGLRIAGLHCPDFGFEKDPAAIATIANLIRDTRPDIVFVALGSPKQEKLISQLREISPAIWWIGVGISFSFVCGDVKRAPKWMQRLGLEWIHRLLQEPRRLARRYLVDDLPFVFKLFAWSIRNRSPRSNAP